MPRTQVGQVSSYPFGAPAATGTVLVFKSRDRTGGPVNFLFETPDADGDITVSVEVSPDGITYVATTAGHHGVAVTAEVILPRTRRDFTVALRATVDNFVRIRASGSDRGSVQIRANEGLESLNIQNQLP